MIHENNSEIEIRTVASLELYYYKSESRPHYFFQVTKPSKKKKGVNAVHRADGGNTKLLKAKQGSMRSSKPAYSYH